MSIFSNEAPSFVGNLYKELSEEVFLIPELHLGSKVFFVCLTSKGIREKNNHLMFSFILKIKLTDEELNKWFNNCISTHEEINSNNKLKNTEFSELFFYQMNIKVLKDYLKRKKNLKF